MPCGRSLDWLNHAGESTLLTDIELLQGTWKQIEYERDGIKDPPDEQGWQPCATFSGHSFVVTLADGNIYIKGNFTLDPSRNPKAMDVTDTFGPEAGQTLLAIYQVDGDRFVFCAAYPGKERPRNFGLRRAKSCA